MSRIKECFRSRWLDEGRIVNVDMSQMEVIASAILSGDPVLKADIKSGMDMHKVRAAQLFNIPESHVTKGQRSIAKAFSFQLSYGAGPKSMAAKQGVSLEVAQDFIRQYYSRYSVLKKWQDQVAQEVEDARRPGTKRSPRGEPLGYSIWNSATGRRYRFDEQDAPDWMRERGVLTSFSPTEMKNYAVQGYATADVMALYRAMLYREMLIYDWPGVVPVNTVHDSVMFDAREMMVPSVVQMCREVADLLPKKLKEYFDMDVDLAFPIDVEVGPTWGELRKYTI